MSQLAPIEPPSRAYVWYAIALVFLVSVFNVVDRTIIALLAPGIQADLSLSDAQLGWLLGPSFSIVHFVAVLPAAWLADRTARRSVIAAGLFVWSGMTALGGAAQSFLQLFLTRMGVGLGEAAGSPPAASLLADTAPEAWRARALSSLTIGALTGIGVGMMVGGYVSQHHGWRAALVAVGAPGVLVALLVRFTLREPPRGAVEPASPLGVARHLFAYRSFAWTVGAACLAGIGSYGRNSWEPTFLARSYELAPVEIGTTYFAVAALPTALGALIGSIAADRLRGRDERWPLWICALGNLLGAPFLLAFFAWPSTSVISLAGAQLPVGFVFWAIGSIPLGFYSAPTAAVAQSLAQSNMRALAHAIWTMLFNLIGMGIGPLLTGQLSGAWAADHGDAALRYALMAVTFATPLSALLYLAAARTLRADLSAARRATPHPAAGTRT